MSSIAGGKTGATSEVEVTVTVEEGVAAGMAEGQVGSGRVGWGRVKFVCEESEATAAVVLVFFVRFSMMQARISHSQYVLGCWGVRSLRLDGWMAVAYVYAG